MRTMRVAGRRWPVVALLVLVVAAGPACARKYQAEQDGKDVGEALCDLRDASTAEEAQSALQDLESEMDDVSSNYAVFTAEDRADITENLSDLAEHVEGGNATLAQQDMTVIRRSLDHIREDLGEAGKAAIDGLFQGIDDCLDG